MAKLKGILGKNISRSLESMENAEGERIAIDALKGIFKTSMDFPKNLSLEMADTAVTPISRAGTSCLWTTTTCSARAGSSRTTKSALTTP